MTLSPAVALGCGSIAHTSRSSDAGAADVVTADGPTSPTDAGGRVGVCPRAHAPAGDAGLFAPPVTYPTPPVWEGVAPGDFNGDGVPDLVSLEYGARGGYLGQPVVLLGEGDGTFKSAAHAGPPRYLALTLTVADFNGDGTEDLLTTGSIGGGGCNGADFSTFPGNGDGTFGPPIGSKFLCYLSTPVAVDVNGDGLMDVVTSAQGTFGGGGVSAILGRGDGTFGRPRGNTVSGYVSTATAADLDGDGKPDLIFGTYVSRTAVVGVILGGGDGTFHDSMVFPCPGYGVLALATGDFDGDGRIDVASAGEAPAVSVLLGNGDGTLRSAVSYIATGRADFIAVGDFDGDGHLDLVVDTNPLSVLLGKGDGTFVVTTQRGVAPSGRLAVSDFNGDGLPDLASAGVQVYLNRGCP